MEQNCLTCGVKYDYFQNQATIVCLSNHVVCKPCAKELIRTSSKCPHCLENIVIPNPYENQSYGNTNNYKPQPQQNNNKPAYWQPPQSNNIQQPQQQYQPINYLNLNSEYSQYSNPNIPYNPNQPYNANQGFNPGYQPQAFVAIQHPVSKPGKFCCISVFFLIISIILLIIRLQMNSCQYWGVKDCSNYYGSKYCCTGGYCETYPSKNCNYIYWYEDFTQQAFATIGMIMLGALSAVFLCIFLSKRKTYNFRNNYVRTV